MGLGVYFVFKFGQALRIGKNRNGNDNFDIWSVSVDQKKCPLRVGEHPGWMGMEQFKEIVLSDSFTGPAAVRLHKVRAKAEKRKRDVAGRAGAKRARHGA